MRAPTFDRWLCLQLHRLGWMGEADRKFLGEHVRPGMTVLDIGANQGLYTSLFARLVGPSGRVVAFEPDDMLYNVLAENVGEAAQRNVELHHLALGSESGKLTLHRSLLNSGDNRLAPQAARQGVREPVQISVMRLDEALAGQQIDFVKMDVQGWEMEVFRGMEGLLDDPRNAGMAIYFEFWPQGLQDAGSVPLDVLMFLVRSNFQIFHVRSSECVKIEDVRSFLDSVKTRTYRNLYAIRSKHLE